MLTFIKVNGVSLGLAALPVWASRLNRDGHGIFNAPSVSQPAVQVFGRQPAFFCQLSARDETTFKIDHDGSALIPRLVVPCRPSAIRGFVMAVIVDSVKAMATAWAWPHVGEKGVKRLPSTADANTSRSIVGIDRVVGIIAAGSHRRPCRIFRALRHAVGSADTPVPQLFPVAPAGCGVAGQKKASLLCGYRAAFALALNATVFSWRWHFGNDSKTTKCSSNEFTHGHKEGYFTALQGA